jgi:hypothetical protein
MKHFAWILFVLGLLLGLGAAWLQACDWSRWLPVFLGTLSGAAFSVLASLVVNRMTTMHQLLAEILAKVKGTNPLTGELGHYIKIKKELFTDMGVRVGALVIVELDEVIAACNNGREHGRGADPLYRVLKKSMFRPAVQSIFCPQFPHGTSEGDPAAPASL